ncbi:hypothetical protein BKA93DRAFT_460165 [Sparassis latifolia]
MHARCRRTVITKVGAGMLHPIYSALTKVTNAAVSSEATSQQPKSFSYKPALHSDNAPVDTYHSLASSWILSTSLSSSLSTACNGRRLPTDPYSCTYLCSLDKACGLSAVPTLHSAFLSVIALRVWLCPSIAAPRVGHSESTVRGRTSDGKAVRALLRPASDHSESTASARTPGGRLSLYR